MTGSFTISDTINTLDAIFEKHEHERICVLATTCTGKTTLIAQRPHWVDVDTLLGERMSAEEIAFCSQVPWTEEIGKVYGKIMHERVNVVPGYPLFCSEIIDCEVVVFLDIADELLRLHCQKRGVDFSYALQMKDELEKDWRHHKERSDKVFYYVVIAE
jgi:hypothetical protein